MNDTEMNDWLNWLHERVAHKRAALRAYRGRQEARLHALALLELVTVDHSKRRRALEHDWRR